MRVENWTLKQVQGMSGQVLERCAIRLNRHPGLDPGSIFFNALEIKEEGGCRIKSGMTKTSDT
jgi:hypothetical protein